MSAESSPPLAGDALSSPHERPEAPWVLASALSALALVVIGLPLWWLSSLRHAWDSADDVGGAPAPAPPPWRGAAERRAEVLPEAAALLAREYTPPNDGGHELVVVDVRGPRARWAWGGANRSFDSGGVTPWHFGTLPHAALPAGVRHVLWSDGVLTLSWRRVRGSLVVTAERAPGATAPIRTMVSGFDAFRGIRIPAGESGDVVLLASNEGEFARGRQPDPLACTLVLAERDGELVVDLDISTRGSLAARVSARGGR